MRKSEDEELRGRLAIADAALERIDELSGADWTNDETIERVRALYEFRRRRFKVQAGKTRRRGRDRGALARSTSA